MIKQIALLQTYIGYLEKGYDIARTGLNTISDIKNGHWKTDTLFFNSLQRVNPEIKNYAKVAAIIEQQKSIVKQCGALKKQPFNANETVYVNSVITHLLGECSTMVNELTIVLTDHVLQMSDDERIKNIDRIYKVVDDQYDFIRSFSAGAMTLIRQRAKEKNDINVSKKLNGL